MVPTISVNASQGAGFPAAAEEISEHTKVSPHVYSGAMAVIFDPLRVRVRPDASHSDA